ncbi:MAG TPA: helix-turn-helix transcriptional regulator [Crocinitomicaceae bacterium]|nr:helix-turn-helix transcriptional regulator [Crocinitomicaceae bacterium]
MSDFLYINKFSDKVLLQNIGNFIQQTRIQQNRTQGELAKDAAISRSTLSLIERGENISLINLIKILRILDSLYVLNNFQVTEEISPLKLAKGEKQQRKRASKSNPSNSKTEDSEW